MVIEAEIEKKMFDLLNNRAKDATICPSEVARALFADGLVDEWRELMEPVRTVARSNAVAGRVQLTQSGVVVDPEKFKGPIRIRLVGGAS